MNIDCEIFICLIAILARFIYRAAEFGDIFEDAMVSIIVTRGVWGDGNMYFRTR